MNCPNCGKKLPEGKLYCEACGTELQIVPEYDFSVDNEIKKTMKNIVDTEFNDDDDEELMEDDPSLLSLFTSRKTSNKGKGNGSKGNKHLSNRFYYILIAVVLLVAVVIAILVGNYFSEANSLSHQLEMAEEEITNGDVLSAIGYYEEALKLDPGNSEIAFNIATYYFELGRDTDAIVTLTDVANNTDYASADRLAAYDKIIAYYEGTANYTAISDLLTTCDNEAVVNKYSMYYVDAPSFSVEEGTYTETVALKLECQGDVTIYYTLDGTEPTESSDIYDGVPVFLEYGSYTVSAFSENEYGIRSEIVTKKYLIDVDFVFEPDILTDSGDYTSATMIEVDVPLMYEVYYTTNGTAPTKENGTKYQYPIPMPLGASVYKFIEYAGDGTTSEVVERDYNLTLNTTIDPAAAVELLSGALHDSGHVDSVGGNVDLLYTAPYAVENMGDFYFIVEYITDEAGNQAKNAVYAVDCYNGMVYTVTVSNGNEYTLTPYR